LRESGKNPASLDAGFFLLHEEQEVKGAGFFWWGGRGVNDPIVGKIPLTDFCGRIFKEL